MDQQDDVTLPPPAGWIEALERSEAQLAAGQIVDGATVMRELHECVASMEATPSPDR
jgi:hypothetical protein